MYMYEAVFFNPIVDACKATIQVLRIRFSFNVKLKNSCFSCSEFEMSVKKIADGRRINWLTEFYNNENEVAVLFWVILKC